MIKYIFKCSERTACKCIEIMLHEGIKSIKPMNRSKKILCMLPKGARRFNITDKVIIIFVQTDINRRCQTHKEIIVASLKREKRNDHHSISFRESRADRDNKMFITSTERCRGKESRLIHHRGECL